MAYTKQTWQDLPSKTTPINASRLGHIEQGIYDAASTADTAASNASSAISGLADKVDKVEGKGLSTNDFTDALKTKLDNIETGAEVNVQSDWNQSDNSADDYIKNKPSLGTASAKNSTSVVTDSSDLVESGAVYTALQADLKNTDAVVESTVGWTGKNHCQNTATTLETAGMKYTVNADGTVDLSGTPTSNVILEINKHIPIPSGIKKLRLSGLQDTVNIVWHRLQLLDASDNVVYNIISGGNTNYDYVVDISAYPTAQYIDMEVKRSENNVTVSGTIKPMVMDASIIDTTFEPYHASVEESLAEKCDNSVIGTVEDGTNPTKSYAVGEHMIRGGKFCTVTSPVTTSSTWTLGSNYVEGTIADNLIKQATFSGMTGSDGNLKIANDVSRHIIGVNAQGAIFIPFQTSTDTYIKVTNYDLSPKTNTLVNGTYYYI